MNQWPFVKILYSKYLPAKSFYHTIPLYDPCSIVITQTRYLITLILIHQNDNVNVNVYDNYS